MADNPVPLEGSLVVSEEAAEILKKTAGGSLGKSDVNVDIDSGKEPGHDVSVCKSNEAEAKVGTVPDTEQVPESKVPDSVVPDATVVLDSGVVGESNTDENAESSAVEADIDIKKAEEDVIVDVSSKDVENNNNNNEKECKDGEGDKRKNGDDSENEKDVRNTGDDKDDDVQKDEGLVKEDSCNVKVSIDEDIDNDDSGVGSSDTMNIRPEVQDMFLRQHLLQGFDRENLVSSASFISMESDVTYGELERHSVGDLDKDIAIQRQESFTMTKKDEFDEVFSSVPEGVSHAAAGSDPDKAMQVFARDYVKGIIEKAADQVYHESFEDQVVVRHQSVTAENVDIKIPKGHFSEDLMETVTPFVDQNVKRGSVDILTPMTAVDSANSDDSTKFFSFKVETEPDVVLTSVDEEKDGDAIKSIGADAAASSVSGFGVCVVGNKSVLDEGSLEVSPFPADTLGGSGMGIGSPEFISMSVSLDDDTEPVAEGNAEIDENDIMSAEQTNDTAAIEDNITTEDIQKSEKDSNEQKDIMDDESKEEKAVEEKEEKVEVKPADTEKSTVEEGKEAKSPKASVSSETGNSTGAEGGVESDPPSVDDVSGASYDTSETSTGGDIDRKKSKKKDASKKKDEKKKKDNKSVKKKDSKEEKKSEAGDTPDPKKKKKDSKDEKMKGGQDENCAIS